MGAAEHNFDPSTEGGDAWAERAPRTVTTLMVGKLVRDGGGAQRRRRGVLVRGRASGGVVTEVPLVLCADDDRDILALLAA